MKISDDRVRDIAVWGDATVEEAQLLANDWLAYRATGRSPEEIGQMANRLGKLESGSPDDLRAQGWSVAVHNDYQQFGIHHTFWLLTNPDGRYIKGEGQSDDEALYHARTALQRKEMRDARPLH